MNLVPVLQEVSHRIWARLGARRDVVFVVRCFRLFQAISGRDRVLMLAGQGFIAIVPLLIVIASFTTAAGVNSVGDRIIARMSLTGSAADGVRILFAYPPGTTGGITLFSTLLLLYSVNSFARSVQRTFESAWGLPRMGMRGTLNRTGGLLVLLGVGTIATWARSLLDQSTVTVLLALALQLALLVAGWLLGTVLMLSKRKPARDLARGAVFSAAVQVAVGWGTALYIPDLFQRYAERYGVIGVALALVTWLIAVAATIVGGAIVGAVLGTPRDPGPTLPWLAPADAADKASRSLRDFA
jgi:membrane protein